MYNKNNKILLKDILPFEKIREENPGREIKLKFNVNWNDVDYVELYKNYLAPNGNDERRIFLEENMLALGNEKQKRIKENDIVFQFIEIKTHKWLFIGAQKIIKRRRDKKAKDPIHGNEFELAEAENFNECNQFIGRVIISFTLSRSYFYTNREIVDNIEVDEVLSKNYFEQEEEFVGYKNVRKMYEDLKFCIDSSSWRDALSRVYGVYLITDCSNGKLYVGSATGEYGIYGRWKTYLDGKYDKSEDYPNKELNKLFHEEGIQHIKDNFQYTILEIFPKDENGKQEAIKREQDWKKILRSIEYGYNAN